MAVRSASSASKAVAPATSATTAQVDLALVINDDDTNQYALAGVLWAGAVDMSAATFTATIGGLAMEELDRVLFTSNHYALIVFGLAAPPHGDEAQSVVVDVSDIPTGGLWLRKLRLVSAVYAGTSGPTGVVLNTPSITSSNSVVVPSGSPSDRVVAFHAATELVAPFFEYNQTKRARDVWIPNPLEILVGQRGEDLLLGDAPGAATVTSTATQMWTETWAAIGVSLGAAEVSWEVGSTMADIDGASALAIYRVQDPAPDRTWLVDGGWVGVQDTRVGPPGTSVHHWEATTEGWQAYAANGDPIGDPVVPPGPPINFAAPVAIPGVTGTDRVSMPRTLTSARMRVASAPVGSALTAEVQHYADGVGWITIGTLAVADGSIIESSITLDQPQLVDDLVRLNVTSVGSTTAATGVVVDVFWNPGIA